MIKFYSTKDEYGCFSNFSRHVVEMEGKIWRTSEHFYQAKKFAGTPLENAVRDCATPKEAAAMGRDRSLPMRKDWDFVKDDIMREVVYAKFSQLADLKQILLSTGNQTLVEHSENDSYWADGGDGSGKNMLGVILMEVRERLRKESK